MIDKTDIYVQVMTSQAPAEDEEKQDEMRQNSSRRKDGNIQRSKKIGRKEVRQKSNSSSS